MQIPKTIDSIQRFLKVKKIMNEYKVCQDELFTILDGILSLIFDLNPGKIQFNCDL